MLRETKGWKSHVVIIIAPARTILLELKPDDLSAPSGFYLGKTI